MSPTEWGPQVGPGESGSIPSLGQCNNQIFPCPGEVLSLLKGLSLPRAPSQTMGWRISPSPSSLGVRRASVCSLTGRVNYPRDSPCCWSFGFFPPEFPVDGSGLCAFPIPAALPWSLCDKWSFQELENSLTLTQQHLQSPLGGCRQAGRAGGGGWVLPPSPRCPGDCSTSPSPAWARVQHKPYPGHRGKLARD